MKGDKSRSIIELLVEYGKKVDGSEKKTDH
jgi:hypothetical protein